MYVRSSVSAVRLAVNGVSMWGRFLDALMRALSAVHA